VHKKQHDARHFCEGYEECDKSISAWKDEIEVYQRDPVSKDRTDNENRENAQITGYPDVLLVVCIVVMVF